MTDFLKWLTDLISQLGNWGYALMALIAFVEAIPLVGWLIPGVVILIFGGFLVTENVFFFFFLIVICASFTFLGDMVAFAWGRRFSGSFKNEHRIMKESYLSKAKDFIKKRGTSGIFLGRFISPIRSVLYFVLGIIKMPWLKFILPVAVSSFIFTLFYIGIGYLAGSAWQTIETWSGRLAALVSGLILTLIILWWLKGFLVSQGKQLKELIATALVTFFTWYQTTSWWKKFISQHPLASKRITKLTNPSVFSGLPLFSLWLLNIILVLTVFYFSILVQQTNGFIVELDYRLQILVKLFAESHLATTMFFITSLGSAYFVVAVGLMFSLWLWLEKRRSYFIGLWIAISGTFLSGSLIKLIIARPRPVPTFFFENSYAFPSLHAALALALLAYGAYYAISTYPRWSRNISLFLIMTFIVLAIGFSRIYLGVHYLSDVIGGYLVGSFWLVVAIISQKFLKTSDKPRRFSKIWQLSLLSGMAILLAVVYVSQIFKPNDINTSFFRSLSSLTKPQLALVNTSNFDNNLLVTENLRGGRRRPINFIFKTQPQTLNEVLIKSGWVRRLEPTLLNVISRGTTMLFKIPYPNAPLRPRFWNNQLNSLTFTKVVTNNKQIDFYILRLWPIINPETAGQQKFIAELSINKDFSLRDNSSAEELSAAAQKSLLSDLMGQSVFKSLETFTFPFNPTNEKDAVLKNITVYVITL